MLQMAVCGSQVLAVFFPPPLSVLHYIEFQLWTSESTVIEDDSRSLRHLGSAAFAVLLTGLSTKEVKVE